MSEVLQQMLDRSIQIHLNWHCVNLNTSDNNNFSSYKCFWDWIRLQGSYLDFLKSLYLKQPKHFFQHVLTITLRLLTVPGGPPFIFCRWENFFHFGNSWCVKKLVSTIQPTLWLLFANSRHLRTKSLMLSCSFWEIHWFTSLIWELVDITICQICQIYRQ